MKKSEKRIVAKTLILTMLISFCFTFSVPKLVYAVTPNIISFDSDPFHDNFQKQPYDVMTADFGQVTFKATDDDINVPFNALSPTKARGLVYAGYYTGDPAYHGLMISDEDSKGINGIWFAFKTKDISKTFSFKSFNLRVVAGSPNFVEVKGFRDGMNVATQMVNFSDNPETITHIDLNSTFRCVDEIRMRQMNPELQDAGFRGFEDIVVNDLELGNPIMSKIDFSKSNYDVEENVGSIDLEVNRTVDTEKAVTVDYATSNGTAIAGTDYTETSGTLKFASGETSKKITIPIIDNSVYDGDKSLNVVLSKPTGGAIIGDQKVATVIIKDNEQRDKVLTYAAGEHGKIMGNPSQTVKHGANGTEVTAVPDEGYSFIGWSDGISTASRTDMNVAKDINVTANFEVNEYTLNYLSGAHGRITGVTLQKVKHGLSGSAVTAIPDTGYKFVDWSDGVKTLTRTDANITGNKSVTANFAANEYTLTYKAGVNGMLKGNISQTVKYGENGTEIEAVPNPNYHFVSWSDGVKTSSRTDTNVTKDINVTASFEINQYTLSYIAGSNGSVLGQTLQNVKHGDSGSEVIAMPDVGYHFIGWSDGVKTEKRTDSNVIENKTATANFAINEYTLTYAAGANGSITGQEIQKVNYNLDGAKVTAVANPGYHFVSWSDGVKTASRKDTNVIDNINVTASFEINQYTLNYAAGANGTIIGDTSQTVDYGSNGSEVKAVANAGYHFVSWNDGVKTAIRKDRGITGNINVIATFEINQEYTLTYVAGVNGTIIGNTSQKVNIGESGTEVKAVANPGYHFVGWSDGVKTESRTDTNVISNIKITASFEINSYTVIFKDYNGDIIGTVQTVKHGSKAEAPKDPTRIGYIFKGWNKSFDNVIGDLIVTATYTSGNTYNFPASIPSASSDNKVEAKIPVGYLESRDNTLVVNSNIANISIPAKAIDINKDLGDGYIKVTIKVINDDNKMVLLNNVPNGTKAVGNPLSLDIQLFDKNDILVKCIHEFENNEKVKVTIKLTDDDIKGLDTSKLSIYYYNEVNKTWEELGGNFDEGTMTFTFYTQHFSIFAVMQKTSTVNPVPTSPVVNTPVTNALLQTGSLINTYTTISFASILMVAGFILLRRKTKRVNKI
ncbi:repeat domain (List_Bact_rpt) [Clostridium cavendishii DSM 21758]|uniref:Repeat domain (List_Bact_rpt) n=1 Tax=Clostridium cavendishii DSM 21758 TaxID=1121302 RepID=A0A1M6T5H6_9CLOT|nr:InlB B-repeat-containing protein [Clostridium cavendishii]SHK52126.1 repeat domain (List_Bact_rpt) [Clostridium cavendishii DSM 21758]